MGKLFETLLINLLDRLKASSPKVWGVIAAIYGFIFAVVNIPAFETWLSSIGAPDWALKVVEVLLFLGTLFTGARTTRYRKKTVNE